MLAHRIHIPIITNEHVRFEMCARLDEREQGSGVRIHDGGVREDDCVVLPMYEGQQPRAAPGVQSWQYLQSADGGRRGRIAQAHPAVGP
ncbi:uncharacterized protein HaLaN_21398, partial [Haematococcus lacustris]